MTAKEGDKVKVHYTGKFDDGVQFDSSEGKDPIEFTIGEKKVIKGFEEAITGMKEGEEKDVKIEAIKGYGIPQEKLIQEVPKTQFPPEIPLKEGTILNLKSPQGHSIPAKIKEVKDDKVVIDLNHPLAGKNLNFKLKLVEINK